MVHPLAYSFRSPVVVGDGEEQADKDDSEYRTTTALVPAHIGPAPATQPRTWQQLAKPYVLLHQEPLLVMCTIYLAVRDSSDLGLLTILETDYS